ncbi:enoyl-CoA hydratase [Salipiger pallidus]|uniref:Enoyl-CoA hydratase n=1 Tax=Salipiger pallidus TaxID=1775170 RepID=A0A8J2ZMF0_9RHOB|nr:enoyl-CoA hydratase [Salipiger pallidus]
MEWSARDGVAILTLASPPSNPVTPHLCEALHAAFKRAASDPEVDGVLLHARGRSFSGGDDPCGPVCGADALNGLFEQIETCPKPVVAALHGLVLGSGVGLALAAHYRIAAAGTRLGLPEVKLGLVPGGGTTQRLPRLLGADAALEMMLGGGMHPVDQGAARGIVDSIAEGYLLSAAEAFLRDVIASGQGARPSSLRTDGFADPAGYQKTVAHHRGQAGRRSEEAPREIIAAVEAAMLLPFEAGLSFEADAAETCRASAQATALRAAFLAERRARGLGLEADVPRPALDRVAVLGGGALAVQVTFTLLNAGIAVNWGTRDPAQLLDGVPRLRDAFDDGVARGTIGTDEAQERMASLRVGDSAAMTGDAQLILHAAKGQGDVPAPQDVPRAAIFPGSRVEALGLRFAQPVPSARLVEVMAGPNVTVTELAVARTLVARLGKVGVRVNSSAETVGSRLLAVCQRAVDALIDAGQDPYAIDRAFLDWGWLRPPLMARDVLGLAGLARHPRAEGARNWSAVLLEAGRSGRASGKGVYDWTAQPSKPAEDAGLRALVSDLRPAAAPLAAEAIVRLVLGAMANEGARMLSSGMVAAPSEIDLVALHALEMPRWRGGPMHLAGAMGLLSVRRALESFEHPDRPFWTPEPIFAELIKNGRSFDSLDGRAA